jgi:hypothetical protein
MGKLAKTSLVLLAILSLATGANAATPVAKPTATPVAKSTPTPTPIAIPAVTGVSATWVTLEGFVVGWVPVSGSAASVVTGYTVTSSSGQTCVVNGANASECVFSNSKVPFGFKPFVRYTFSVVANGANSSGPKSADSNAAGWFGAPAYPTFITAKTISDTQIDLKWIPDASTGGMPLSGYKVYYWPLNNDNQQKMVPSLDNSVSLTGLTKSTFYVIAIQACNYYGCTTSDPAYQATTPATSATSPSLIPRSISGGAANTTCWDVVIDGGSASSSTTTITKAPAACPVAPAPSTWPKVDPTAVNSPNLPIATKFNPRSSFSLANAAYSMAYKWNDLNITTTNFSHTRSLATRAYESLTPTVCSIILKNGFQQAHFLSAGTCTIRMSIAADETYVATAPLTASFVVKP